MTMDDQWSIAVGLKHVESVMTLVIMLQKGEAAFGTMVHSPHYHVDSKTLHVLKLLMYIVSTSIYTFSY